ncbi:MAG TPA: alpha/beta fold hydrolase [Burkholderiales bacterium]|jgi:dienelactone hydrolase|nr:alpha/beta fold hydrolase [Burkholderiales bacterium]
MSAGSTWTDSFPGNFQWSNATLVCKGMAPYGAVALEEIERICERLRTRGPQDPDAWPQEWCAEAQRIEALADAAAAGRRDATAGNLYLRAGNYYYAGERFVPLGEKKLAIYGKALRCYQEGLRRRHPEIEFCEVPYEGKTLPAYFMKAQNAKGRAPTVVLFDGMDNCKEMSVLFAGLEFARRGFNTLAIDGPGQGETLRLRKIYARHDYEAAGTAAYEFVARRPDVDPKKAVIMGYSFGGYYAPRIAAFERRYAACVCLGALHWDLHAWQKRIKEQLASDPKKSAQSNFQFQWILGLDDSDAALEHAKDFSLAGVAEKIACPVLITHGANDRVVPVEAAHKLYAELKTPRKALKIFTPEEGGAEHCQVDDRPLGIAYIADWIAAL